MELELDQAKLYFETQGDKSNPPLVLWHGAGCTLRMWDYVVEELKKDFFRNLKLENYKKVEILFIFSCRKIVFYKDNHPNRFIMV